jgi:MULE transposase domain/Amyotrophic lateral sclerosis 2 chromosomal region candidate gene 8
MLVDDGVFSVAEMRRHIHHFVSTEIFNGKDMPPETDRRFFPTTVDYRNIIYRARAAKIKSKVDQVNLKLSIDEWKKAYPNDMYFFREYSDTVKNDDDDEKDNDDDDENDVLIGNSSKGKGLLYCHQTDWQRRLLKRYGNEICLLDATYRTSRYALPLFFVCVKTNVNYSVVASFVVQSESTSAIAEALEIIQKWNPDWQPMNWMIDFSEMEINALETVFPGK